MQTDPHRPPSSHHPPEEDASNNGGPAEAWREVVRDASELREYAIHFVSARLDGIKLAVRMAGIYAVLGIIAAMIATAIIVTSVVLLISGLAGGLAVLFGNRLWIGNLVVGLAVLLFLAGGAWLALWRLRKTSYRKTVLSYEDRQRRQRARYGRSVDQRAKDRAN